MYIYIYGYADIHIFVHACAGPAAGAMPRAGAAVGQKARREAASAKKAKAEAPEDAAALLL